MPELACTDVTGYELDAGHALDNVQQQCPEGMCTSGWFQNHADEAAALALCVKVVASLSLPQGVCDKRMAGTATQHESVAVGFYKTGCKITASVAACVPTGFTLALQAYIASNDHLIFDRSFEGYHGVRQLCAGLLAHVVTQHGLSALQDLIAGALWLSRAFFVANEGWRVPVMEHTRPEHFATFQVFLAFRFLGAELGGCSSAAAQASFLTGLATRLQSLYGKLLAVVPDKLTHRSKFMAFSLDIVDFEACASSIEKV